MKNKELIDRIERVRVAFVKALDHSRDGLPQSSASMELIATRLANRTILELESEEKQFTKKKKS